MIGRHFRGRILIGCIETSTACTPWVYVCVRCRVYVLCVLFVLCSHVCVTCVRWCVDICFVCFVCFCLFIYFVLFSLSVNVRCCGLLCLFVRSFVCFVWLFDYLFVYVVCLLACFNCICLFVCLRCSLLVVCFCLFVYFAFALFCLFVWLVD